jgi:integration host factor subunit beta
MTRSELVGLLHTRFPVLLHDDAKSGVTEILDTLTSYLVADHRAEIRGFGSFQLCYRKPWIGRNPKTGV